MTPRLTLVAVAGVLLFGCAEDMPDAIDSAAVPRPPNILLIVVDDMGYTDLGAFGSEIPTPNLDELAYAGLRLTNFHASGQCAPTRAMLMSGADNHKAGMGSMFGDNFIQGGHGGRWGYERYLHPRVASLPERLKDAGYQTYMAGKWHLGGDDSKKPSARGFDRTFALMDGSASHFRIQSVARPAVYREDGVRLDELPNGFYSTNTYTNKLIGFIDDGRDSDKPFFAYLALTAPHWPLQVPDEYLDRFRGDYDEGYDALRARRLLQGEKIGAVPAVDSELLAPTGKRWDELDEDERRYSARTMELYAAMVQNADDNVGRLMTYLRDTAQFDNTFVFFMSDNGAEADRDDKNPTFVRGINRNGLDNGYETLGTEASWPFVREGWAQATAAPFRLYKGFLTEGGTRVAAFAVHPAMRAGAEVRDQYLTVMDVMPTLLEIAGAEYDPNAYAGREVLPMDGTSFMSLFDDPVATIHHSDEVIASELHGQRALVRGDYKIVWEQMTANVWWADEQPEHWRRWRLYNLAEDPTEQHDLADAEPERLAELAALWDEWAATNDVMKEVTPYWPE